MNFGEKDKKLLKNEDISLGDESWSVDVMQDEINELDMDCNYSKRI